MKVNKVLVVTDSSAQVEELVSAALSLGENVELVYAGAKDAAAGAAKAYWLGELKDNSFINFIPAILDVCKAVNPDLVIAGNTTNGRLASSQLSVALGVAVLSDVAEACLEDGALITKRLVYGGAAYKTEKCCGKAVMVPAAGAFPILELAKTAEIVDLSATGSAVEFVEQRVKEGKSINLAIAKKVVAVGRGVPTEEYFDMCVKLAEALGCEVGCTRPIAEDNHWLPKEAYIGVSGVMMKPDFYIGLGISGQIQHTVGINTSRTVFAINKDKNCPMFEQCDYGLVADVTQVLPILLEKLS